MTTEDWAKIGKDIEVLVAAFLFNFKAIYNTDKPHIIYAFKNQASV